MSLESSLPVDATFEAVVGPEQCVPLRRRAIGLIDYARDHSRLAQFHVHLLPHRADSERAAVLESPDHMLSIALGRNGDVNMFNELTFPAELKDQNQVRIDACKLETTRVTHLKGWGMAKNPWAYVRPVAPMDAIELWNDLFDKIEELKSSAQTTVKKSRIKRFFGRLTTR